jgi:hypothetical protein
MPFLITGLVLFILGLLSVFHQVTLFNILFQVLPDPQVIDFFGIMVQVAGQSLVILSFTKFKLNNKLKEMQAKTQQATEGFKEKFQQFQISIQKPMSANNSYHANTRFDVFLTVFASFYRWRNA